MADGHGVNRRDVMYNDFIVVGPLSDPVGIIAVNPARHPGINHKGAMQLIDWISSDAGQQRIAAFRMNGEQLFLPPQPADPVRFYSYFFWAVVSGTE